MTDKRVTAIAAAALSACLFLTVALVNVPHDATDADLLSWWQESANRWSGVWSGVAAIGVAVAAAVLRHGLGLLPGTRDSAWMAFGRSMATAVMCLWLVTGAIRGAVGHLVDRMDQPLPGLDVLRTLTAVNYMLLGLSGMAALALMMLGVSIALVRSGELAPWISRLGIVCGALVLLATLAQYGAYATLAAVLWLLCLAIALWRNASERPGPARGTSGGPVKEQQLRGSGAPGAPDLRR
jgi:hypothetical protein